MITDEASHPLSFENWNCKRYGHWQRHDGPHTCAKCGEHIGSVLSEEPYDYPAARRELEAVHAFIREHGLVQAYGDGEWGRMSGGYEPEWDEAGGTVEALRQILNWEGMGEYYRGLLDDEERARMSALATGAHPNGAIERKPTETLERGVAS